MVNRRLSPRFRVNANFRLFANDGGVGGTTEAADEEEAATVEVVVGGNVVELVVMAVDEAADVTRVATDVAVTVFLTVEAEVATFQLSVFELRGKLRDGRLVGFLL